jgi:hypothetical protein
MNTLTRVILPIAVVAGLVFGITFIANYSPTRQSGKDGSKSAGESPRPLRFPTTAAVRDPRTYYLSYWQTEYEVGAHGHFDYWFTNSHAQPVRITFDTANCQCAGADLGIIPADAWADYLRQSALAGMPGLPTSLVVGALNTAALEAKIGWTNLKGHEDKKVDGSVPAASQQTGPQMGILRLNWTGKETTEGNPGRELTARFVVQLPGANGSMLDVKANFFVVPPYRISVTGPLDRDIKIGDMVSGATVVRDIICWSQTRPEMNVAIEPKGLGEFGDCVEISKPEPLTREEHAAFARKLTTGGLPGEVKSAYKCRLTVHERREITRGTQRVLRQLDVGPFQFELEVNAADAKPTMLPVSAMVRGEIRMLGAGKEIDRIDFGPSFAASEPQVREVLILSEQPNIDLDVDKSECTPQYIDVPPLQLQSDRDGVRQWVLTVKIPANKLSGTLEGGFVVLKTKGATPRRIRIPIRASTKSGNVGY